MPLKPHPTDPDKMVYASRQYDIPQPQGIPQLQGVTTAQPAQEPVAWMSSDKAWMWSDYSKALAAVAHNPRLTLIPLYITPPQRPWVGLTNDEWFEWWRVSQVADATEAEIDFADFLIIAQAVTAKLKEKNNG